MNNKQGQDLSESEYYKDLISRAIELTFTEFFRKDFLKALLYVIRKNLFQSHIIMVSMFDSIFQKKTKN